MREIQKEPPFLEKQRSCQDDRPAPRIIDSATQAITDKSLMEPRPGTSGDRQWKGAGDRGGAILAAIPGAALEQASRLPKWQQPRSRPPYPGMLRVRTRGGGRGAGSAGGRGGGPATPGSPVQG